MTQQDAYNKALGEVDVLVMPTVGRPPPNFGDVQEKYSPAADNNYLPSVVHNTAPFDSKLCCSNATRVLVTYSHGHRHWSPCSVIALWIRSCCR